MPRIVIGPPGSILDWDNWGKPVTDAINEHDATLSTLTGVWAAWTPTLTNLTLGNGSVEARYNQVGKTVDYTFRFTLGSTSAVGSNPQFTLPVASRAGSTLMVLGDVIFTDTGTTNRRGYAQLNAGSTLDIIAFSTTGTSVAVSATSPHTWAATDVLTVVGRYEAA